MPSSYSTNLKIELQATGENSGTWGNITNTNLGTALEQAIVGYGNPSYASDANLTLTYTDTNAAQAARALVLNVTSAVSLTGTRELVVPTIQKQYIVQNNTTGSQSITVKTSAGTGITVPNGRKAHLYVDGTNVIYMDDFVDINGGAIDGTTIGANSAAAGTFTTVGATTGNITTVNATTVDTTNIEVTNLKAKDGTAAGSIADSTGVVTLGSSVLTTTDINGGTIDGTTIGGSSAAAGTFTTLTTSSTVTLNGGIANGVLYLNGSKVATSGSALTFDGNSTNPRVAIDGSTSDGIEFKIGGTLTSYFYADNNLLALSASGARSVIVETNSSERLRVDGSGNVGIGTNSPAGKVHAVASTAGTTSLFERSTASTAVPVFASRSLATSSGDMADGFGPTHAFAIQDGAAVINPISEIGAVREGADNSGGLVFRTYSAGTATTQMRLDKSGNLGLGVTPSAWGTGYQSVFETKNVGAIAAAGPYISVLANTYYNSSNQYIYKTSERASYYAQAVGQHQWFTAASGTAGNTISFTQAMTLDASGNLGVGTSSPSNRLTVSGANTAARGQLSVVGASASPRITLYEDSTFYAAFAASGTDAYIGTESNTPFRFITNGTERARIHSDGAATFGNGSSNNYGTFAVRSISTTGGHQAFTVRANNASELLVLFQNGSLYCQGVYDNSVGGTNRDVYVGNDGIIGYLASVRASKTNITSVLDANWLLQLNPVTFNFRKKDADGNYTDETDGEIQHGLIAEEVEAVKPELCFYDEVDGKQELRGVSYSKLVTPMLKLIQQQQAAITALEAKVAALEAK